MGQLQYSTLEIQTILDNAKKVSDSAEESLDTLIEVANAIGNDPNFANSIMQDMVTLQTQIENAEYVPLTLKTDTKIKGSDNKYSLSIGTLISPIHNLTS